MIFGINVIILQNINIFISRAIIYIKFIFIRRIYMEIHSLIIISIALALDAFGVALSIGLNPQVRRNNKILFILSFGFFQFFFSFLGAYIGYLFNRFTSVPNTIGGIVIMIVGMMMIKEGMEKKEESILLKPKMYFILGISVSIDALVVGFVVLSGITKVMVIGIDTIFIGLITCFLSTVAFVVSKSLKKVKFIAKYADFIGGIILIIFGLKMIL